MAVAAAGMEAGKKGFDEPLGGFISRAGVGVCTTDRDRAAVLVCVRAYHDAGQKGTADSGCGGSALCIVADSGISALVLFQ